MKQSDEREFAKIMLGMADNFRETITPEGMAMRFDMLKAFSIDDIREAAKKIILTRKYTKMPPIAEFIEALGAAQQSPTAKADQQADLVIETLRTQGSYADPIWEDPVTFYLMTRRWPWRVWASRVQEKDLVWFRRDFREAYIENDKQTMKQLPGGGDHDTGNVRQLVQ